MTKLIIIDDSPEDREWLTGLAQQAGWTDISAFDRAAPALDLLGSSEDVMVLMDYNLEGRVGIVDLGAIFSENPKARAVLLSGQESSSIKQIAAMLELPFLSKGDLKVEDLAFD
ncbi:MAG: response regulator [Pseudomonadota bacterium]